MCMCTRRTIKLNMRVEIGFFFHVRYCGWVRGGHVAPELNKNLYKIGLLRFDAHIEKKKRNYSFNI